MGMFMTDNGKTIKFTAMGCLYELTVINTPANGTRIKYMEKE
jgi:hypothetical protein